MSSEYIKGIKTFTGDKQIDYTSLANLPVIPTGTKDLVNDAGYLSFIPSPTKTTLGGIKAQTKDEKDTAEVKLGADGKLYVNVLKQEIETQAKRIDNIIALPEGSTSGDAELIDARIGHEGTVYTSTGESIRNQISDLHQIIDEVKTNTGLFNAMYDKETCYLRFLDENGEDICDPVYIESGSGGGSGGGNHATLTVANTSGWISNTISDSEDCIVSFIWSSTEDGLQTGNGSLDLKINGSSKFVRNIQQGEVAINIKDYLGKGSNVVRLTVSDVYGNAKTLALNVTVETFSLKSSFDDSVIYSGIVQFPYTPTGNAVKTMQFILDGSLIGSVEVTTSGRQQNFTIPAQAHGSHNLEVYFTATINENVVESNHLYYDIVFTETGNTTPIIAASFNADSMSQYYTVSIPYLVYTPNSLTSDIKLCANGEEINSLTVDRTKQIWTYRADTAGELLLEIVTGDVRKSFNLTVSETDIDVSAEENDLDLHLTSYGRSNAEANPGVWEYGNISATFEGFNFVSDGWLLDKDNNTVLRVAGDARLTIPLNLFGSDFRTTGKTIEFEFATRDILDYEAEIISCFNGGKGLVVTPQKVTFTSEQSNIFAQYKEDEHVRVSFVIDKKSGDRLISVYINGILSRTVQYPDSDDFQQAEPVGITIGSNNATIDLYCIRVYSNNLTRYQMLDNWIADTQNGYDMLLRFSHNNIYDAYGQIVISKLPTNLPYLVFECATLPQYKGDKKTCSGYYVNPSDQEKSFRFENATIDVQGTSSQYYKRKNYKVKFENGFIMELSGQTLENYQMRDNSIGVNTFTFKADVASSEGANNVELVGLYNDICPYKTPPQLENADVRQGIDGFPIVIFWANGTETTFLGKYNFNNDKGTEEVFGFEGQDESWEIRNNTSARSMFKSADFSGTAWMEDFEGRYPDGNTDPTKLAELATWLVSTDQAQATNAVLDIAITYDGVEYITDSAEYRLAKFKAEAEDWLEMDSIIFSYIFTELFLLVDSRAKNNFPTIFVDGKWCVLPYDMDTAIGTNNEGLLVFDYNLEDTDTVNGSNVYNGQDSVLYINTRDAFADRIEEMYGQLRSDGLLSYDIVEKRFSDHQALWPEAIFNEDAYFKYISPLTEDGEATYLSMCQGSKESQRKWWLFNRFRYIDSKYTTGDALTSTITLRAYQKSDFEITPYADIYPCVAFDSTRVKARGRRGEACAIVSPATWDPNGSDAVVTVYSADQLKDIGDISPFKVGYADFSKATKIQRIKAGDASADYSNPNMTEFYAGNNTLLKVVDLRNCPNLTGAIELAGCANIEEIYLNGTTVTSVSLPNGGVIKVLHLPETLTNLTIRNHNMITDLVIPSYANVATLWLENIGGLIDTFEILKVIPTGSRVRLIGVEWSFEDATEIMELNEIIATMRGLDENGNNVDTPQINGTCHITELNTSELAKLQMSYPYLTFTYDNLVEPNYFTRQLVQRTYEGDFVNESATSVGALAFRRTTSDVSKLTTVTLLNVTVLNAYALSMAYGVTKLDLPYATKIDRYSLNTGVLETLILRSSTMCTLTSTDALTSTPIANGTGYIYVPKALVDTYKTATNWSTYADQFRVIEDYPDICGGE